MSLERSKTRSSLRVSETVDAALALMIQGDMLTCRQAAKGVFS